MLNVHSVQGGLGAALPDTADAVYQHNQSNLEFLLAGPAVTNAISAHTPAHLSFELMFDRVQSRQPPVPDAGGAGVENMVKGSTVNINLLASMVPDHAKWEGPDFDAGVRARGLSIKFDGVDGESIGALPANGFFRPNPNGDGTTARPDAAHFMDYTDDA